MVPALNKGGLTDAKSAGNLSSSICSAIDWLHELGQNIEFYQVYVNAI
jgi:hypothetical protein